MGDPRYERPNPSRDERGPPRPNRAVPSRTLRRPRQDADGGYPDRARRRAGLSCYAGQRPRRRHAAAVRRDFPYRLDDQAGYLDRVHAAGRGRQSFARRSGDAGDPRICQPGRLQRRRGCRTVSADQAVRGDADGRSDEPHGRTDLRLPEPHQHRCRLSQVSARRGAQYGRVRLVRRRAGKDTARVRPRHRLELFGGDRRAGDRGLADRGQAAGRGAGRAHFQPTRDAGHRISSARKPARPADRLLGVRSRQAAQADRQGQRQQTCDPRPVRGRRRRAGLHGRGL